MNLLITISTFQLANVILVLILLFLAYKYFESSWSYRISKPYKWEQAVKNKKVDKDLISFERTYRDKVRFYNFWIQIERLKAADVPGAFAELGVHKGESAKAIHQMDPTRKFYLFDTFGGFSEKDLKSETQTDDRFTTDNFADTNLEKVKDYLGSSTALDFRVGYFPETTSGLEKETYSFVSIDADLYEPTKAALDYFYHRLSANGVILIHDYNHNWDGVTKAVDEFLETIPESLIVLTDWQGSAMLIKNSK